MPAPKKIPTNVRKHIARMISQGHWNQTEAANEFNVHRRTIQRILIEEGMLKYNQRGPKKPAVESKKDSQNVTQTIPQVASDLVAQKIQENKEIIREVRLRGLNLESLKRVLDTPALTNGNVHLYLMEKSLNELAQMFFAIVLTKQQRARQFATTQEVANV